MLTSNRQTPSATDFAALTVPLIIVGRGLPPIYRGEQVTPGSHLDLAPTLYELCAPSGFSYTGLGTDLFSANRPPFAIGQGWVAGQTFIASSDGPTTSLTGKVEVYETEAATAGRRRMTAIETLSVALLRSQGPPEGVSP